MKTWVVVAAFAVAAWSTSSARAQSRVSVEVGGAFSSYDLGSPIGSSRAGLSSASTVAGIGAQEGSSAGNGIGVFEVRPTIILDKGFLLGVGFRDGTAGFGRGSSNLVGGDVSIGYGRLMGRFLPFAKAMFGFNNYDSPDGNLAAPKRTDLRLDAVLGSRVYVSSRLFVSASAFAGLGDQYGGSIAVGGDILQMYRRGYLP